jgi:hypothetical protein
VKYLLWAVLGMSVRGFLIWYVNEDIIALDPFKLSPWL